MLCGGLGGPELIHQIDPMNTLNYFVPAATDGDDYARL